MPRVSIREQNERAKLRYETAQYKRMTSLLDALPTFARDQDEDDWVKISGSSKAPYTETDLSTLRDQAREWQYRPAGRNILQTMQDFILGKSASIAAIDQDPKVQAYWDEWVLANGWDMRSKEIVRRTLRDGEVFLRWFEPDIQGGQLALRFIDPAEIAAPQKGGGPSHGIETDPADIEKVESYHREWRNDDNNLMVEDIPADEVTHIKILVDSDVKRGVSFFVGIIEYMKHYEGWLADRIKLNKARHIWNVIGEITSPDSVATVKSNFADATGTVPTGKTAKKKVPRAGGVMFNKGIKWDLKALNINASDTADDGRAIQLMIALGTNLPEYVIRGDASNSNYASTMVSESPFVRAMESWQDFFEKPFAAIFERVIQHGIANGAVPARTTQIKIRYDAEGQKDIEEKTEGDTITKCHINFATLITRNPKEETDSLVTQNTSGLVSKRTASEKLGYDYEDETEQMAREDKEERDRMGAECGDPPANYTPSYAA